MLVSFTCQSSKTAQPHRPARHIKTYHDIGFDFWEFLLVEAAICQRHGKGRARRGTGPRCVAPCRAEGEPGGLLDSRRGRVCASMIRLLNQQEINERSVTIQCSALCKNISESVEREYPSMSAGAFSSTGCAPAECFYVRCKIRVCLNIDRHRTRYSLYILYSKKRQSNNDLFTRPLHLEELASSDPQTVKRNVIVCVLSMQSIDSALRPMSSDVNAANPFVTRLKSRPHTHTLINQHTQI